MARFEHNENAGSNVEVAPAAPTRTEPAFDVILLSGPPDKKMAVREVRPGIGLAEAKIMVESVPRPVLRAVPRAQAEAVAKTLRNVGAKVEVR